MPLLSAPMNVLLSQTELADDCTVTLDVYLLQVVEQVSSVTDHLLQTATAVEVLLVGLQVHGQIVDAGGQNRNLNLGRACVSFVGCVLLNESEFFFFLHGLFHLSFYLAFTQQSVGEVRSETASSPTTGLTSYIHIIPHSFAFVNTFFYFYRTFFLFFSRFFDKTLVFYASVRIFSKITAPNTRGIRSS